MVELRSAFCEVNGLYGKCREGRAEKEGGPSRLKGGVGSAELGGKSNLEWKGFSLYHYYYLVGLKAHVKVQGLFSFNTLLAFRDLRSGVQYSLPCSRNCPIHYYYSIDE